MPATVYETPRQNVPASFCIEGREYVWSDVPAGLSPVKPRARTGKYSHRGPSCIQVEREHQGKEWILQGLAGLRLLLQYLFRGGLRVAANDDPAYIYPGVEFVESMKKYPTFVELDGFEVKIVLQVPSQHDCIAWNCVTLETVVHWLVIRRPGSVVQPLDAPEEKEVVRVISTRSGRRRIHTAVVDVGEDAREMRHGDGSVSLREDSNEKTGQRGVRTWLRHAAWLVCESRFKQTIIYTARGRTIWEHGRAEYAKVESGGFSARKSSLARVVENNRTGSFQAGDIHHPGGLLGHDAFMIWMDGIEPRKQGIKYIDESSSSDWSHRRVMDI
ncbi:hypothetical protein B0H11DRAFT_1915692 [Mycena galericulata]|nr:hypothetical protein B0H11DRAFT_1915692 [Mycena galericulata]